MSRDYEGRIMELLERQRERRSGLEYLKLTRMLLRNHAGDPQLDLDQSRLAMNAAADQIDDAIKTIQGGAA